MYDAFVAKERRNSRHSDRGSIVEQDFRNSDSQVNGFHTQKSESDSVAQNDHDLRSIPNGYYHANSPSRHAVEQQQQQRRHINKSTSSNSVNAAPQSPLKGQSYDRYLSSQLRLQQVEHPSPHVNPSSQANGSGQQLYSASGSQAAINQEETFGVFISNEDPVMYQRRSVKLRPSGKHQLYLSNVLLSSRLFLSLRFKYYQRMRKHRKNPEVQSDLGYYGRQYRTGSTKASSESGQRMRRPLQQGRDGFDQWERYSQRSMGDGYASDLESFSHNGTDS